MNPVIREAVASIDAGWVLGIMTVVFLVAFLGWAAWAYAPSRRETMEEYGRIPFSDGSDS